MLELEWHEEMDQKPEIARATRRVKFDSIVKFRGVPSCHRGRRCGRSSAKTTWQKGDGAAGPGSIAHLRVDASGFAGEDPKDESASAGCPECGQTPAGSWRDLGDCEGTGCTACAASGRLFSRRPATMRSAPRAIAEAGETLSSFV